MGRLPSNPEPLITDSLSLAYDRWVNGSGYSAMQLITDGPRPTMPAARANEPRSPRREALCITLDRFENERRVIAAPNSEQMSTVSQILIHGSQATNDTCEFSDIDVLVILDDTRTFSSEEHARSVSELKRLLASMYAYDSLMHHGLMFFQANALSQYDESFLPVETLKAAKAFHGSRSLWVCVQPANEERKVIRIGGAIASLKAQLSGALHLRGDYHLKNFISGVLLLPALFLASRGIFVYKRESFELARPSFSAAAWDFIAGAEEVRREWVRPSDSWFKRTVGAMGHPRTRTLISQKLPSRINPGRPSIRSLLTAIERRADLFFGELEEAVL